MINRICVVGGLGNIGEKHVKNLKNKFSYRDVHAYDPAKGATLNLNWFKALIIATPSETHYEIAKTAIENGQHVLIEKPVTLDYKEAQTLYRLAQTYRVVFYTGHCYRYLPQFLENLPELFHTPMLDFKLLVKHDKPLSDAIFDLAIHGIEIAFFLGDQQKGRNFKLKSVNMNHSTNRIHIEANIGSKHCKFIVGYNQDEDVRALKGYNVNGDTNASVDFHSSDGKYPDAMSNLHGAFIDACNKGISTQEAEHAVAAVQLAEQVQKRLFS